MIEHSRNIVCFEYSEGLGIIAFWVINLNCLFTHNVGDCLASVDSMKHQ